MAEPKFEISGDKVVARKMGNFSKVLSRHMRKGMVLSALLVRRNAQKRIRGARATNPPDRLGVVTGRGRGSIIERIFPDGFSATVGTNVPYMRKHEFGIGVRKRSFLQPALDESRSKIVKILNDAVGNVAKELNR